MIRISKYHYPYLYEYERLGRSLTAEGKDFLRKYMDKISEEQDREIKLLVFRIEYYGGTERIHKSGY